MSRLCSINIRNTIGVSSIMPSAPPHFGFLNASKCSHSSCTPSGVHVRMLIADWANSNPIMFQYLDSLDVLDNVEVRLMVIPRLLHCLLHKDFSMSDSRPTCRSLHTSESRQVYGDWANNTCVDIQLVRWLLCVNAGDQLCFEPSLCLLT